MEQYRDEAFKSDASLFPSYTKLTIPYRVICRQRYYRSQAVQKRQFLKEHARIELLQPRGLDGVRIHREFVDNVMEPLKEDALINLTNYEKRRLEFIMEHDIT